VKFVFYILLLASVAGILHFSPFSPTSVFRAPVLFFTEPSHYAIAILPFLLYIVAQSRFRMKLLWLSLALIIALVLQNLTFVFGISLVALIVMPFRQFLYIVSFGTILLLVSPLSLNYYFSRVTFTGSLSNLSTLVFLSGWERAFLSLKDTYSFGIGFQQFGIIGRQGQMMERLAELNAMGLNNLNGGSVAPKLIGEFGLFGLGLLSVYFVYFFKNFKWLHDFAINTHPHKYCKQVFYRACFVMYSVDLFVRGTGYFSAEGFLFVASIFGLLGRSKELGQSVKLKS